MAIDKTIRIQDLPASDFLNYDNLFVINDSDNITRKITFENLLESITEFPGGINLPPTEIGNPGLNFCPEEKPDCGTGIGSGGDCNIFISICGDPVLIINEGPTNPIVGINGDLEVDGDLTVNKDTLLLGDVNIGNGNCGSGYDFTVDVPTFLNCEASILGDTVIGDPNNACQNTLDIHSFTNFTCKVEFNDDITLKPGADLNIEGGNLNVTGDITIDGEIKPPDGQQLDIIINNLVSKGDIELGDRFNQCQKDLDIYNDTTVHCNMVTEKPVHAESNITIGGTPGRPNITLDSATGDITARFFRGDGSLLSNLNIPDSMRFKGSIDVVNDDPTSPVPVTGDFYININGGDANANFVGIDGQRVELNQIVYYAVIENVGSWGLGALMDPEGFVTLATYQEITGAKDFTNAVNFTDYVQCPIPLDSDLLRITNVKYVNQTIANYVDPIINGLGGDFVTLDTDQEITGAKDFTNAVNFTDAVNFTSAVNFTGYAQCPIPLDSDLLRITNVKYVNQSIANYVDPIINELDPNTGDYVTLHTPQNGTTVGGVVTPVIDSPKTFSNTVIFEGNVSISKASGTFDVSALSTATYQKELDGTNDKEIVNVEFLVDYIADIVGVESRWKYTDIDILDARLDVKIKADSLYPVTSLTNIYTEGELQADKGVLFHKNPDIMTNP